MIDRTTSRVASGKIFAFPFLFLVWFWGHWIWASLSMPVVRLLSVC